MEKRSDNSAFWFFLYLVSFLALGFLAVGVGMILFQIINKFLPDVLRSYSLYKQNTLRIGIAFIFVAAPVYFIFVSLINRRLCKGEIPANSKVRKWLTYIILFLAAAVIIVDLITLITNFLDGETAVRFLLKVLVVFVIAAAVFGYYFWELRKKQLTEKKYKLDKWAFGLTGTAAVAVLVSGLLVIDSPAVARDKKIDKQVLENLFSLEGSINYYYQQNGVMPQSLSDMQAKNPYVPKMEIDANIVYEVKDAESYELCADFRRSNIYDSDDWYLNEYWQHESGRVCFARKAIESSKAENIPIPMID